MKDVKKIIDIPDIEEYRDLNFVFDFYVQEDKTQGYTAQISEDCEITVEIISDENTFFRDNDLDSLVTQNRIYYFSLCKYVCKEALEVYSYRPLVHGYKIE